MMYVSMYLLEGLGNAVCDTNYGLVIRSPDCFTKILYIFTNEVLSQFHFYRLITGPGYLDQNNSLYFQVRCLLPRVGIIHSSPLY